MSKIAVITTFPNSMWNVYARKMIKSHVQYWPKDIPLMIQLDDDLLYDEMNKMIPPEYGIFVGQTQDHLDFIKRNKDKDHETDYRKQAVRFCHKVFAIHKTLDAIQQAKAAGATDIPRYLIWLDADVITTKPVTLKDLKKCLPKKKAAVAYLGRSDWDHSECGWLAFDLENSGDLVIESVVAKYTNGSIFNMEQWHDSWVWDKVREELTEGNQSGRWTNLTANKPGTEIWAQSPMASWSVHYKGPIAKQQLFQQPQRTPNGQNFVIQTKNAIPDEEIHKHIEENQRLIKNWLVECKPTKEEITVVSAGPLMIPEDVRGKKIIAVKHALKPLKEAGVTPWACILLDPRPHVADFVKNADPKVKWFVASQVNPKVTQMLLDKGCEVWGYHASVGADEGHLTTMQAGSIISGGSATATRGLYLLYHLGFRNFNLYGYDLCYPDKPDMAAKDQYGQPKYMEFSVGVKNPFVNMKRNFFSEPQLIAQFEEMRELLLSGKVKVKADGYGMIPFMAKLLELTDLRQHKNKCIVGNYKRIFLWQKMKTSLTNWRNSLHKILLKTKTSNKLLTD